LIGVAGAAILGAMSWIFSLSVECGSREAAGAMKAHFDRLALTTVAGDLAELRISTHVDTDGSWWCWAAPAGFPSAGPSSQEELVLATHFGHQFYGHLREAPDFRFALTGVEVDEFRLYSQLDTDIDRLNFAGLVVSEAIWTAQGSSKKFESFRPGYRWRPYEGEHEQAHR